MILYLLLVTAFLLLLSSVTATYLFFKYNSLKNKHLKNPNAETQLMMADLLSGNHLFRIERIDTENLFLRR